MTMRVTILSTVMGESGSLLEAGSTYTVGDQFGQELVNSGRATDTDRALAVPQTELKPYFATDPITGNVTGLVGPGGVVIPLDITDNVKTLDPVDFFQISALDVFGANMYGFTSANSSQVAVLNRSTGVVSNYGTVIPATGIVKIKVISPTTMIVGSNNGSTANQCVYYRTTDSGANWTLIMTMAFAGNELFLQPKGVAVATIGNRTVLLAGDYNTNASRVNGSTNDAVYLRRSDDFGATWTEVTRWNTDGSNNNIRHIHAVKQFEPNGRIFVFSGDTDTQSAIYSWDGVEAWPVNVSPASVVQTNGLKNVSGRQCFRAIDPILKDGYLWWGADAESGASVSGALEAGIWKMSQGLDKTTLTRIGYPNSLGRNQAIWFTQILSTGQLAMLSGNAGPIAGQKYNQVIISNKAWTKFEAVGAYRSLDSTTYISPYYLDEYAGNIYVSCFGAAGKTYTSTVSCKLSANDFRGNYATAYRPETIHPVYWVDQTNGSDANDGFKPSTPFKSMGYALTGARMTYGARLQIVGNYEHGLELTTPLKSATTVVMNGNSRAGDPTEPLVIAGSGATKTVMKIGTGAVGFTWMQLYGATAQKLEWQDLKFDCDVATSTPVWTDVAQGVGAHTFGSIRCIVGDHTNTAGKPTRYVKNDGMYAYARGCVIDCQLALANAAYEGWTNGSANFYFEDSVLFGGNRQVLLQGTGNTIGLRNVKSIGAYQSVLNIAAAATVTSRSAIYCDFYSDQVSGAVVINDQASLTWAGEFKSCNISGFGGGLGVASAFDGYSTVRQWPVPVIRYADYVY